MRTPKVLISHLHVFSDTKLRASPRIAACVDSPSEYPWALQWKHGPISHLPGIFSRIRRAARDQVSWPQAGSNPRTAQPLARWTPQHHSHRWCGSTLRGCDAPCIQLATITMQVKVDVQSRSRQSTQSTVTYVRTGSTQNLGASVSGGVPAEWCPS